MKKILALVLVMCFLAAPVMALENGTSVKTGQVTLVNAATGTTSAVNYTYTFDNVMKYIACDLVTGISAGTSNVTLVINGNQGTSSTLFDSTAYLVASTTLASSTTATVMKTVTTASSVPKPFRTIQAVVTSPTTTQVITLNCSATQ